MPKDYLSKMFLGDDKICYKILKLAEWSIVGRSPFISEVWTLGEYLDGVFTGRVLGVTVNSIITDRK
jgi:predicted SpoU family rRNA methylase